MILVACSDCHRQYDVSHLEPGAHVRCACERLITVPSPRELAVHALTTFSQYVSQSETTHLDLKYHLNLFKQSCF